MPDTAECLGVKPLASSFDVVEHRGWRELQLLEALFESRDLREHGLGHMLGAARCSCSTPELARDGAKPVRLVQREQQKPAIPVAEPHAADLTPWIGSLACAIIERDLGWQFRAGFSLCAPGIHASVPPQHFLNFLPEPDEQG